MAIIRAPRLQEGQRVLRREAQTVLPAALPAAAAAPSLPDGGAAAQLAKRALELQQQAQLLAARDKALTVREERLHQAQAALHASAADATELAAARGHEEGLARGRSEAAASAKQQLQQRMDLLDAAAKALGTAAQAAAAEQEDALVELAFTAICKIMGEQAVQADGVRALVGQALAAMLDAGPLEVRVHPDELAWLQELSQAGVAWLGDAGLASGGCIVRGGGARLDARLDMQLQRLRDTLLAARSRRREGPA